MESYDIIEEYFPGTIEQLDRIFYGLAIPCMKSTADGNSIASEKVLKFCKSTMQADRKREEKKRERMNRIARLAKYDAFYNDPENKLNERSLFDD
jgi:hypothetical protein